jgi:hypothetical protein
MNELKSDWLRRRLLCLLLLLLCVQEMLLARKLIQLQAQVYSPRRVIFFTNLVPSTRTPFTSPHTLVTGERVEVPLYGKFA